MVATLNEVSKWNERANKRPSRVGSETYWDDLQNQFQRIKEELEEVREAIKNRDLENLTKEVCDLDITTMGFVYLLQSNHAGALIHTLNNNDKKVYRYLSDAQLVKKYYDAQKDDTKSYYIDSVEVDGSTFFTVKRSSDDKVVKPPGLNKVHLSAFTPQEVQ